MKLLFYSVKNVGPAKLAGPLGPERKRKDKTLREDDQAKRPSVPLTIDLLVTPSAEVQKALMDVPCVSKWIRNNYNHGYNTALSTIDNERREWKAKEANFNFSKICDRDRIKILENNLLDSARQLNLSNEAYNKTRSDYEDLLRRSMSCTCDAFGYSDASNANQATTSTVQHSDAPPSYSNEEPIQSATGNTSALPTKNIKVGAGPFDSDGDWTTITARIKFLNDQCEDNLRLQAKTKQDIKAQIAVVNALRHADNSQPGIRETAVKAVEKLTEFAHLCIGGKQQVTAIRKELLAKEAGVELPNLAPHITVN